MSHTMAKTRMAVGSGAALLAMLVLPAGHSVAAPAEDLDVSTCLAPLGNTVRSPDVLQGWIDGCRRQQPNRARRVSSAVASAQHALTALNGRTATNDVRAVRIGSMSPSGGGTARGGANGLSGSCP
jgi:hypothetical protein